MAHHFPCGRTTPETDEVLFDGKSDVNMKDDVHVRDFPLFPWECLRDSFHWTVHAAFFILSCCTVCPETCLCRGQALSGWITVKVLEKKAGGKKKKLALYEVGLFLLTGLLVHKINFISILSPMQWINFAKSFWKTDRGKAFKIKLLCSLLSHQWD